MPNTQTLGQLRDAVRARGQYENSIDISDSLLLDFLNKGIAETYDLIVQKWQDYYTTSASVSVVAGVQSYPLPSDFYKLRKVEIVLTGTKTGRLFPHDLIDAHLYTSGAGIAHRFRYRIQAGNLVLVPVPSGVDTLILYYIPYAPKLVDADDSFDGINQYEELVIQFALRLCKIREDLPHDDIDQEIARLTARIRTAADGVDASEPFYLCDYGGGSGFGGGSGGFGGWGW